MTTAVAAPRLIPLDQLAEIVTSIMRGREHMSQAPFITRDETGWLPPAPLPPDSGLRLQDLLEVLGTLPDPCDELEAATAICQVIRDRGYAFLVTELGTEWEARWASPEQETPAATLADSVLTCQWCQRPIPLARGPKARYCRNSHRVSAHRAAKRERERQANAGASPGR
jgi:hypothetical protein